LSSANKHFPVISNEQFYQTILQAFPGIAVVVFDARLRCRLAQGNLSALFDLSEEEFRDQPVDSLFDAVPDIRQHCLNALKGIEGAFEHRLNGRFFYIRSLPISSADKQIEAGMLLFEEIPGAPGVKVLFRHWWSLLRMQWLLLIVRGRLFWLMFKQSDYSVMIVRTC
jgi:PAS domain-containing protein